ncbi:winged helix-turn-helix domain-containing protein [Halococcus salsus]|uniref:winged helix-turn-helix domain-containing protein n=1 Tax=Halococcus salsus TaxID=2162894 RepID=UPI00135BCA60|nr:winged helix-turn-helix domain-containing protein [Halococcus salsus]
MATELHTETEPYADDTPLTHLFGSGARVKILAALLGEEDTDLNVTDIARLAGVARSTVYDHIDELRELGVVEQTRDVGDSPMYRFDTDTDVGEYVAKLEGVALRRLLERDGHLD